MSAAVLTPTGAEVAVQAGVLKLLRQDFEVQKHFGSPGRIFEEDSDGALFPFAVIERHETRPLGGVDAPSTEHIITIGLRSQINTRMDAKAAMSSLRAALEAGQIEAVGQRIVLVLPVLMDVMRRGDLRGFRGMLRVRIISEPEDV